MVAKCANHSCAAKFLYLQQGALFSVESSSGIRKYNRVPIRQYQPFFTIFATILPIACGSHSPAVPSSMYVRSNPFGPRIFISHWSLACDPRIETFQCPRRSASACSM